MSVIALPGGVTRTESDGTVKCYAQVKPLSGLPARRCHRNARTLYSYQGNEAPLCGQHSRYLEQLLHARNLDYGITTLVRWSRGR